MKLKKNLSLALATLFSLPSLHASKHLKKAAVTTLVAASALSRGNSFKEWIKKIGLEEAHYNALVEEDYNALKDFDDLDKDDLEQICKNCKIEKEYKIIFTKALSSIKSKKTKKNENLKDLFGEKQTFQFYNAFKNNKLHKGMSSQMTEDDSFSRMEAIELLYSNNIGKASEAIFDAMIDKDIDLIYEVSTLVFSKYYKLSFSSVNKNERAKFLKFLNLLDLILSGKKSKKINIVDLLGVKYISDEQVKEVLKSSLN